MEYAAMTPANQEADHPATDKCGYDRTASLSVGVYVCACGFWDKHMPRYRFSKALRADAGEETYKEIRRACDEKLAAVTADLEHARERWEAELSTGATWQHRAEKAEAERDALQDQLKLAEQWRTGYEQAKAENAALREWESRCAVALGVPGCHPEEMLHVIDNQREDAERYRWFRSKRLWDADSFPWPKDFEYPEPCLWDDGEMLDAAIDAARKA